MVPTASTNSQPRYAAAPTQNYPGVDNTSTGSVTRAGHPVPRGDVSTGQMASAPVQSYPTQSYPAAPVQSYPAAPASAPVQSASLPPVSAAPAVAQAPVVAAPARPADRPAVASVPAAGATVTVQSGDTIYGLARRHGVSAGDIMRANGLKPDSSLVVGRKIVIPGAAGGNIAAAAPVQPAGKAPLPAKPDLVATLPAKTKAEPVVAAAPKPVSGNGTYTVASGDSLYTIARKLGTTTEALKQANGLKDGYLKIGQTLNVPGASAAPTQVAAAKPARTDPVVTNTAAAQARSPEVAAYTPPKATETAVKAALEETGTAPTATGIGKMRWPVRGKVVSGFGDSSAGKANDGIDISVPEGTPVKAAENGIVIYAGDGLKEFGNTVLVRHEDGTVTVYGHASKLNVTRGEKVKRGQDIALSGMSGSTDRPKLHFEVRKNSSPVNPSGYLE